MHGTHRRTSVGWAFPFLLFWGALAPQASFADEHSFFGEFQSLQNRVTKLYGRVEVLTHRLDLLRIDGRKFRENLELQVRQLRGEVAALRKELLRRRAAEDARRVAKQNSSTSYIDLLNKQIGPISSSGKKGKDQFLLLSKNTPPTKGEKPPPLKVEGHPKEKVAASDAILKRAQKLYRQGAFLDAASNFLDVFNQLHAPTPKKLNVGLYLVRSLVKLKEFSSACSMLRVLHDLFLEVPLRAAKAKDIGTELQFLSKKSNCP